MSFVTKWITTNLLILSYAIYNESGDQPKNLVDFVQILQEKFVIAIVLLNNNGFEVHKSSFPCRQCACELSRCIGKGTRLRSYSEDYLTGMGEKISEIVYYI